MDEHTHSQAAYMQLQTRLQKFTQHVNIYYIILIKKGYFLTLQGIPEAGMEDTGGIAYGIIGGGCDICGIERAAVFGASF